MMKKILLKRYNNLIGCILAVLGFASACDNSATEYGTPHAEFIVKGIVTSEKNNSPIKNIRLIFRDSLVHYNYDTTFTDVNGNYTLKMTSIPENQTTKISVSDIDGITNGEFLPIDTVVEFKNSQFTGGDGWFKGTTQKEIQIKLKPKQ